MKQATYRMMTHISWRPAILLFCLGIGLSGMLKAQTPEEIIQKIKSKLDRVNDYEAKGKMKTNVLFLKAPVASVKVYYKKPNRVRINNENGISFIPKGSVNINLASIFVNTNAYNFIDVGKEAATGLRIIKLLPKDENAEVVLSTLYIDESRSVIIKAKTTTRENGTYELEMSYGKFADWGLADRVSFSFSTKDYKLPKGITFDYDDGTNKEKAPPNTANKKGRVDITYTNYIINKGVPDSVFE